MSANIFISYSHADEKILDRLHKHMAILIREGSISTWYDRKITPGNNINEDITEQLSKSDIFLAILSADYISSEYCYNKEFEQAKDLQEKGLITIIPIISEPCDWLSSPLSEYLALPKDGKPISDWSNANTAYLDIINGIRKSIKSEKINQNNFTTGNTNKKIKITRDFDTIEKKEFANSAFKEIERYFLLSSEELAGISDSIKCMIESDGKNSFSCTIVNRAKAPIAEEYINVWISSDGKFGSSSSIEYSYNRRSNFNSSNGQINIENDKYNLYLKPVGFEYNYIRNNEAKYTSEQAAEWLWNIFVKRAGIEYE